MTIEMHGGHFGSHPADRFISTRRIGESKSENFNNISMQALTMKFFLLYLKEAREHVYSKQMTR